MKIGGIVVQGIRLWADENGKTWAKNVVNKDFQVLLVSQFTLYGKLKGNKPDFHDASRI
jgi:D-tyrosyl-tRNA(Tyr) deacylase